MIALCREHADKADNGSYTDDQLRRFKAFAADSAASVRGEFSWMRNKLIGRMGGNFYVDTTILVAVTGLPLVWFERNKHGELMLNYRLSGQRAVITNNSWEVAQEELQEVICKPGGRSLDVRHLDGSRLKVVFSEHVSRAAFRKSYPKLGEDAIPLADSDFPVTVVDVTSVRPVGTFQLHPGWTSLPNGSKLRDHWFFGNRIALELGLPWCRPALVHVSCRCLRRRRYRQIAGAHHVFESPVGRRSGPLTSPTAPAAPTHPNGSLAPGDVLLSAAGETVTSVDDRTPKLKAEP